MMRDFAFTTLVILSLVAGCAGPNATQTSAPTRTPITPTATPAIETQETTESPTLVDVTAENIAPPFHTLAEFEDRLETAVNSGDIDAFWDTIVATGQMPLIFGDTAVFMYRGEADTVKWSLDYAISDRILLMNMQGIRQGDTDLWVFKRQFPTDARLSYRIILNDDLMILEETTEANRRMIVVFRVYNDGLGFRYELPEQENLTDFQIMDEETEFALAGDHQAWWIPAYQDRRYEYLYAKSPISAMDTVHTPLTMETADGLYLSIHEANLTDYAAMTLATSDNYTLLCDLVPWSDGVKVKASTPHQTPWRTIQIAENPGDLITSYLVLNLNEPNKLGDLTWVKPGKYIDNYESQLEDAFAFYEQLGVNVVKTGYAGRRANGTEWHHGQYMVRHYRKVVETAAKHKIMLNVHEPIKDTGIRRTYPNMMTREGARGMEYDAKSPDGGNPPDHTTIIPFTRMLSGPFDFTPGIFDLLYEEARPYNRVNTTLRLRLAPGGGQAIRIRLATTDEANRVPHY